MYTRTQYTQSVIFTNELNRDQYIEKIVFPGLKTVHINQRPRRNVFGCKILSITRLKYCIGARKQGHYYLSGQFVMQRI